jgi:hypothetical protein
MLQKTPLILAVAIQEKDKHPAITEKSFFLIGTYMSLSQAREIKGRPLVETSFRK